VIRQAIHSRPAPRFDHAAHLEAAYSLLRQHDFLDALCIYARRLKAITAAVGAAEKFNLTMTLAYMSLLAERMTGTPQTGFEDFIARFPELLDRRLLDRYYDTEMLQSTIARQHFLMPLPGRASSARE